MYFEGKETPKEALKSLVVLNPQWLLKILSSFLYDVEVHGSKELEVESDLIEDVVMSEETLVCFQLLC